MKILALGLVLCLLAGCAAQPVATVAPNEELPAVTEPVPAEPLSEPQYESRFSHITEIQLSDSSITVDGGEETDHVFTSRDIIYYEDLDRYPSGNPYGEGESWQRHSAQEAAAHTVVNITEPGAYRVSGKLSRGQLRIDLGDNAYDDPDAVVELILHNADITCTVAPAILFQNTYECDGNWSVETASPEVDTTAAGANLILEGENTVTGSHVAKIYKDAQGEKKLWKQDGAIYSYRSMNVFGPGKLTLTADNEGLDTELHLTICGGEIAIFSDNDGINTNEDSVSVTAIRGGKLTIAAGLGQEGDGIDSNGYLVIYGGTVVASANPAADAGLDSDLGSYIHGGTVVALGSAMDWAESDSRQVTWNLQFAAHQAANAVVTVTDESGSQLFSFQQEDAHARPFQGMILSGPMFSQGQTCHVYVDGEQMGYTGSDVGIGPGGGGRGPWQTGGAQPDGEPPQWMDGQRPRLPEGMQREEMPEGMPFPEGMEPPEGMERPEGDKMPQGGFRHPGGMEEDGELRTGFYLADAVNAFSGITAPRA